MPAAASKPDLPRSLDSDLERWSELWGAPGLQQRVRMTFSRRMRTSLGRCSPNAGWLRLNAALLTGPPELLREVLCHELAHAAAWELHGPGIRPHGREWRQLMLRAGFRPRLRLQVPEGLIVAPRRRRRALLYDHRCPTCSWSRLARAVVRRWRCPACSAAGRLGTLEVWRLAHR